eukprot:CAMPEP_0202051512 /NCGR_PEP_ID=MMETSP0963-20130614/4667_1 /ASSEMBLY_ACC=CAM_ASM_000494 /TAXON_ID=4773 /ORGANISM="Schizochytrium aggregatum, Strain ATCC28209" /LENGTH=100 /DNA_ID=CAMNT_0048616693 /DNA_START=528 /DNA_END=830 /DNA_ORIENTATION=-
MCSRSPNIAKGVAFGERVGRVQHHSSHLGDPGRTGNGRNHCRNPAPNTGFSHQATFENCSKDGLVPKWLVETKLSARVQHSHHGRGAPSTRAPVDVPLPR